MNTRESYRKYTITLLLYILLVSITHIQSYISINRKFKHFHLKLSQNIEERMKLDIGIKACSFLTNIIEYGNNRMARRAVGVIQKMPAYKILPTIDHYNAALFACEKSDQYQLGHSLYLELKDLNYTLNSKTYEALISLSERTGHYSEAMEYFNEMVDNNIPISTAICNSYLWACDKTGNYIKAVELLHLMEKQNIPRDEASYAATIMACKEAGNSEVALHILDVMNNENMTVNLITITAIMWACIKDNQYNKALELFNKLHERDEHSYNAAIWACEKAGKWEDAIELLRLMKYDGFSRPTQAFDGVISILSKLNKWENVLEVMKWMDHDNIPKSIFTYKLAIDALDNVNQYDISLSLYQRAVRENLLTPWIKDTRTMDLRNHSLSLCKVMVNHILNLMRDKKLPVFTLTMLLSDNLTDEIIDVNELNKFLLSIEPKNILHIEDGNEGNKKQIKISRDNILLWLGGYTD